DQLNAMLFQALMSERLLSNPNMNYQPWHLSGHEVISEAEWTVSTSAGSPILLFLVGDVTARHIIMRQLAQFDFILPFDVPGLDAMPGGGAQMVPYQQVQEFASKQLVPLFKGLQFLKGLSFNNLFLHGLPPPTLDDAAFEKEHEWLCSPRLRYKVTLMLNHLYRQFCAEQGVGFIDIWDQVTVANQRNRDYEHDTTHLNAKAALITLDKLMASLALAPRRAVEPQHSTAYQQAAGSADTAPEETVVVRSVDITPLAGLASNLRFGPADAMAGIDLSWTNNWRQRQLSNTLLAEPDSAALKAIYDFLYSEPIAVVVRDSLGCDFAVSSVRLCRPASAAEEGVALGFLETGCPRDVLQCLLVLEGEADLSGPADIPSGPGSFLLFRDGAAVQWKSRAGSCETVLHLVLLARHPHLEHCVISAGLNAWPVDPFLFAVDQLEVYPAIPPIRPY
ncbi:MAG TPA: hypothetical protein VF157_06475, partial [Chloroflexota bacterium]